MNTVTLRQLRQPPNLLSLSRVVLAGLVWLWPTSAWWVLSLLLASGVTDILDGWWARRLGLSSDDVGAWLDPLCDKVFIASALVAVWVTHEPGWWLALVAATREVVLLPLVIARFAVPALRERDLPWKANALGKATTVAQFALFVAVLLGATAAWVPLALVAGALGVGAVGQYALRARAVVQREHPHGGMRAGSGSGSGQAGPPR